MVAVAGKMSLMGLSIRPGNLVVVSGNWKQILVKQIMFVEYSCNSRYEWLVDIGGNKQFSCQMTKKDDDDDDNDDHDDDDLFWGAVLSSSSMSHFYHPSLW